MSGSSAGANLALAGSLNARNKNGECCVLGAVMFYAPVSRSGTSTLRSLSAGPTCRLTLTKVDLRIPPEKKRKPSDYPTTDPFSFLAPLIDSYAGPKRIENIKDIRLNPMLAPLHDLPKEMLFVIPTIDILLYEQAEMIERLQKEIKATHSEEERRVERAVFEGQLHGWLESE